MMAHTQEQFDRQDMSTSITGLYDLCLCPSYTQQQGCLFCITTTTLLLSFFQDGTVEPDQFTAKLQVELKSSPQPYLIPFLKVSEQHSESSSELIYGELC